MIFKKNKTLLLFSVIWIVFILALIIFLEVVIRIKLSYKLLPIKLEENKSLEVDKLRIWNENFVKNNLVYFNDWLPQPETFESDSEFPYFIFQPNLRMAIHNNQFVFTQSEQATFWSSDDKGFRTVKRKNSINPSFKIVTMGASTTEGFGVKDDETYPSYLQKILEENNQYVEVINAGNAGYKIDDIIGLYNLKILNLNPKLVIFYEAANNINFQEWLTEKDLYPFSWSKQYPRLFQILVEHSALLNSFSDKAGLKQRVPERASYNFIAGSDKKSIDYFKSRLEQFVNDCLAAGSEPILTTYVTIAHPDLKIDPRNNKNIWNNINYAWYPFSPAEIEEIYSEMNNAIKEVALAKNIKLIDLAAKFPKKPEYFYDGIHFTARGNELLASFIADELITYLDPEKTDFTIPVH